jgi:NYN domain
VPRIAVFIDWQNAYQQAREAFGLTGPGHEGQFSPLGLGRLLAARNRRGERGQLVRVEVHRGQPLSSIDPVGHAAVALQAQAWKTECPSIVTPQLRPLAKQSDGRFIEKGVDVHIAACAIEWSVVQGMDTVIVFSHDSDLRPAVEALARIRSPAAVETASWRSATYFKRIAPCHGVVNHTLSVSALQSIADPTSYGVLARRRLAERQRARS